jgi:hypothetical protein
VARRRSRVSCPAGAVDPGHPRAVDRSAGGAGHARHPPRPRRRRREPTPRHHRRHRRLARAAGPARRPDPRPRLWAGALHDPVGGPRLRGDRRRPCADLARERAAGGGRPRSRGPLPRGARRSGGARGLSRRARRGRGAPTPSGARRPRTARRSSTATRSTRRATRRSPPCRRSPTPTRRPSRSGSRSWSRPSCTTSTRRSATCSTPRARTSSWAGQEPAVAHGGDRADALARGAADGGGGAEHQRHDRGHPEPDHREPDERRG